jgi:hypothetical protein
MFYIYQIIIAVSIITELVGYGLAAMIFLKDDKSGRAMTVEIGMISRGEDGLITAGPAEKFLKQHWLSI